MFHLSTKPISRATGRSAVASIAYRAGIEITDERTGRKFDYTKRTGVLATNLITPNNLSISRSDLWNKAELVETRKNSRTARETVIHIPHELMAGDGTAGKQLAFDFGKHLSDKYGIAVDVAVHAPDRHGDQRNYHAHILMTTRKLEQTADGKISLGEKSQLEMSNTQLKQLGLLSCQDELKEIRETWADFANKALAEHNIDKRIDHRSHKERGLETLPTIKMGWKATELERQGIRTEVGDKNRVIKAYNAQIELKNGLKEQVKAEKLAKNEPKTPTTPQNTLKNAPKNAVEPRKSKNGREVPPTPKIRSKTPKFDAQDAIQKLVDDKVYRTTMDKTLSPAEKSEFWRSAMEKGIVVDGYEPTQADINSGAGGMLMRELRNQYQEKLDLKHRCNTEINALIKQLEELEKSEPQGIWAKITLKHDAWVTSVSLTKTELAQKKDNAISALKTRNEFIDDVKAEVVSTRKRIEQNENKPKITPQQEFERLKAKLAENDKVKVEAMRRMINYQCADDPKALQAGYEKLNTAMKNGEVSKWNDAPQQVVQQEIEIKLAKSQDKDRGR